MERYNAKRLNNVEVKEQYQIKTSNRFAALKHLNNNTDINRACTSAKDSLGYELTQYKPWFHEECSKLLDRKKKAKLQWYRSQAK
jgi:hypothetical protein